MTGGELGGRDMSWWQIAGPILGLTGPATLSRAGLLAMTFLDTAMVGRVGIEQLAYLAIAAQPHQSLSAMGQGLAAGLPALVATAHVRGEVREARCWLSGSLAVAALLGIALGLVMALGEVLLTAARQPADIASAGEPVLRMFAWSMPAVLMFWSACLYLESFGRPKLPLAIIIAALGVKIVLNLILIQGVTDLIAPLGALGAAISTSIVRWLMLVAILAAAASQELGWIPLGRAEIRRRVLTLMQVGAPVACAIVFEVGGFLTLASFAGMLGAEALAGYQIARNLYQMPFIPSIALGLAVSIFVAGTVGRREIDAVRRVVRVGIDLNAIVSIGVGGAVALFPMAVGGLFTDDRAFLETLRIALLLTALLIVFDGFQGFFNSALRGVSDGLVPSVIVLAAFWAVAVPMAYVLAFERGWGLQGVLTGLTSGLGIAGLLLGIRLFTHPKFRSTAPTAIGGN
ncbi:MAG: MATE family efflux transporter [Alphaproteobacteria bacterium]|nr:MATE family efflux transporter [Alphaproteobacteria bacterium]